MASLDNFCPFGSNTVAVSVSSVTATSALNLPTATTDSSNPVGGTRSSNMGGISVRLYNSTAVVVFVQFGTSGTTATTSHMPIPPGGVEVFQIGPSVTSVAAITSSGSGTLYATTGYGS
jgi:hypothetical protein